MYTVCAAGAYLSKRDEYPASLFSLKSELLSLWNPARAVVEQEAVRYLHVEKLEKLSLSAPMALAAATAARAGAAVAAI